MGTKHSKNIKYRRLDPKNVVVVGQLCDGCRDDDGWAVVDNPVDSEYLSDLDPHVSQNRTITSAV
jgi:hypothetical protein